MFPYTPTPQRSLTFAMLVLVALMALTQAACTNRTPLQKLAFGLLSAVETLRDQKAVALNVLKVAQKARTNAQEEIEFTFTNRKTRVFISKWRDAEREVIELRQDFNQTIRAADFYFAYAEKKGQKIQHIELKKKMDQSIGTRKSAFSQAAVETNQALRVLEREIRFGNDLITALEIAGTLNTVDRQFDELDDLHQKTLDEMPKVSRLVEEGIRILQSELDGLAR